MIQSKVGIPDGTYELQIGKSFSKSSKNRQDYHTLRYDFKPKSVAGEQEAYIAIGSNDDVHIAFPNESADNLTMYKGSSKQIKDGKECLLIFDEERREMRLEKVVSNLNVKQTRGADDETDELAIRTQIDQMRKNRKPAKRKRHSPPPSEDIKPAESTTPDKCSPTNSSSALTNTKSTPTNSTPSTIVSKSMPKHSHSTDQIFAEMSSDSSSSSSSSEDEEGEIVDDLQDKAETTVSPQKEIPKSEKQEDSRPRKYSYHLSDSDGESSSSSGDEFAAELERKLKASLSPTNTTNDDDDMPDLFANGQPTPSTNSEKPPSNSSSTNDRRHVSLVTQSNLANDLDLSESDEDSD